jgi:fructose-1,6-bisphosphatase/inositol monophosphatase family enzyme
VSTPDLELAERCARAAGEVLLSYYGRPAEGLASKSSATDLVSDADREAERVIRELLQSERPDDGLLAEEGSAAEAASGRRWLVDPLDGTVNFLYGFHAWAVSVALEDAEGLAVGVVLDPVRNEIFAAQRGGGAFVNGEPVGVSGETRLERSMIATGFSYVPERRAEQAELLRNVLPRVRDIRRAGAAALDLCFLASGRVDGYWERGLNPWDWAAGRLILTEAGGVASDLAGEPHGLVAAATPALLAELEALVG